MPHLSRAFLLLLVSVFAASIADAQTTFQKRVATGNDDAEEDADDGEIDLDSSDLELTDGQAAIGMRFTSVTIPQGATITDAYIQFTVDETSSGSVSLTIRGQDTDDASGFTSSDYNISSRSKTSASVAWSPSAWNNEGDAGAGQRTPDLTSIVQEIVNRSGWSSGNDMVFIITGTGTRTAESYNGSSSEAPLLSITYSGGGGGGSTTYYVRPDGNNSNSGTGPSTSEAWQSVSSAVDKSQIDPGDTVYVMAGTYNGSITPSISGTSGNPIRFIADRSGAIFGTGGDVILRGSEDDETIDMDSGDDYLEFVGFRIRGATEDETSQQAVELDDCDGIVFEQCEMYDANNDGIDVDNSSVDIINCLIYNNGDEGVRITNGSTVTIWNTTIADNSGDGINMDSGTANVRNCIIASNGDDGFDDNGGTLNHTYNLVWDNDSNDFEGTSSSTGEISQDPQFGADYELSSSSPAIDAGTSTGAPSNDIDENARPDGAGHDMGCYEYQSTPATPTTYYVRPDGNDSNTGTGTSTSEAWQTVSGAATKSLNPGDTIYVMTGTYSGRVQPTVDGTSANPIQFIGDTSGAIFGTGGDITIQATSGQNALDIDSHDNLSFTGFAFIGDSSTIVNIDSAQGIELTRCSMTGGTRGIRIEGTSPSVDIVNCLIYACTSDGILMDDGTVTVHSTTIDGSGSDGIEHDDGTITITNSIISNSSSDGLDTNGGTMNHTYNNVWNNSGGDYEGTSASTGEISQDPQFTSGYELSSSSPCVDAGTSSGAPVDDFDGNARPQQSGFDIGAFEYTPPASTFLGHWKLDETTGTNASDSSGNGNDGTLTGGVTFDVDGVSPGARGNALEFNGADDYIAIPNDTTLQPTNALTIAAFVKGDSWGSSDYANVILRKGEGNPNNYQLAIVDGVVALSLDDNDSGGIRGDTVLETDRWYHVAATWDGTTVRIYVDGELDMTPAAYSGPIGTDTRPAYIGGRSGTDYFDGCIDDVRLYGTALSAVEVMELYGKLLHWKLDESSGTVATDSSGSGRDGTVTGGAWTTGKIDGGLQLDGDDNIDRQDAENFLNDLDAVSVSVWVNADAANVERGIFFGATPAGGDDNFGLRYDQDGWGGGGTSVIKASINTTGGSNAIETTSGTQSSSWQHLVLVWQSGSSLSLYIDGQLAALSYDNGAVTGTISGIDQLLVGQGAKGEFWMGLIDDFKIFNRALHPDEIDQLYSSGFRGLRIIKWVEVK